MHIKIVKRLINFYDIDGYIIPKNDEYFSEYSNPNRLKAVTGFTGSSGLAIILKNKNYLFPSFNTIAGSGKNAAIVVSEEAVIGQNMLCDALR